VLTDDKAAMAKFTLKDMEAVVVATHAGTVQHDCEGLDCEGEGPAMEASVHGDSCISRCWR
jgi:hypothetical protein